jgi:hypothetical protein
MSHLYKPKLEITKSKKLNYFSPNLWRSIYLISTSQVYHTREKKIYNRGSVIPAVFLGYEVLIYSGKNDIHAKSINDLSVSRPGNSLEIADTPYIKLSNCVKKKKNKIWTYITNLLNKRFFFTEVNFFMLIKRLRSYFLKRRG